MREQGPTSRMLASEAGMVFAGREKVGVAGRTRCGKSTLMMALKRIVEPSGGRILVDGIDVAGVSLADLRSRLALVPQVQARTERDCVPGNINPHAGLLWPVQRVIAQTRAMLLEPATCFLSLGLSLNRGGLALGAIARLARSSEIWTSLSGLNMYQSSSACDPIAGRIRSYSRGRCATTWTLSAWSAPTPTSGQPSGARDCWRRCSPCRSARMR